MTPAEQLAAFITIVRREIRRFMRIWVQTLVPPAITMALYFLIFGNLIGSRIGPMGGFDYVAFVAPGLIMMSVITNAYNNVVSSFFGSKFSHCVEEMMVSPTPSYVILLGYTLGGVARGLLVGLIVVGVASFFVDLQVANVFITLLVVFLASVLFSLAGFLNAVYAQKFDDITVIPTFFLTPLIYLSGVFYSVSLLPDFWERVSLANPILYMVNAFRYGILGVSDVPLGPSLVLVIVLIVVAFGFGLRLLHTGRGLRS